METTDTPWYFDTGFSRSNTDAYDGSWSINQNTTTGFPSTISEEMTVSESTDYTLTFWKKVTVNSGNPPKLQLNKTGPTSGEIHIEDVTAAASWTQVTVNFTTDAGQTSLWMRIFNNNGDVDAFYDLFVNDVTSVASANNLMTLGVS